MARLSHDNEITVPIAFCRSKSCDRKDRRTASDGGSREAKDEISGRNGASPKSQNASLVPAARMRPFAVWSDGRRGGRVGEAAERQRRYAPNRCRIGLPVLWPAMQESAASARYRSAQCHQVLSLEASRSF